MSDSKGDTVRRFGRTAEEPLVRIPQWHDDLKIEGGFADRQRSYDQLLGLIVHTMRAHGIDTTESTLKLDDSAPTEKVRIFGVTNEHVRAILEEQITLIVNKRRYLVL